MIKFKTIRANNQNGLDKALTNFVNENNKIKVLNESTAAFYIPLDELPQDIPEPTRKRLEKFAGVATQNYLKANGPIKKADGQLHGGEQPIQYVATLMYEDKKF